MATAVSASRTRININWGTLAVYVVLILGVIVMLYPFAYMMSTLPILANGAFGTFAQFSNSMNAQLNILMAAVAIALLPMFLMYVIGQRFFVEGIAMTGLKG